MKNSATDCSHILTLKHLQSNMHSLSERFKISFRLKVKVMARFKFSMQMLWRLIVNSCMLAIPLLHSNRWLWTLPWQWHQTKKLLCLNLISGQHQQTDYRTNSLLSNITFYLKIGNQRFITLYCCIPIQARCGSGLAGRAVGPGLWGPALK